MKLTIERGRWDRGTDGGLLMDPETKQMCALGFYLKQVGVPETALLRRGLPQGALDEPEARLGILKAGLDGEPNWDWNEKLIEQFVYVNDCPEISDVAREEELEDLFLDIGVEVEFVGEYGPKRKPLSHGACA